MNISKTITDACTKIFDTILPPRNTQKLVRALTLSDLRSLASIEGPLPYHDKRVTALVWELKYRKNSKALQLAGEWLAEQAIALAEDALVKPVLIPVPMHHARRKARGYNQTESLCEAILEASKNSFSYAPHALTRVRNTISQQGLPRHRRLKNMFGAIESTRRDEVKGRVCVVIDDVSTTGATTEETKRALLEAGAQEVHILTLAHS